MLESHSCKVLDCLSKDRNGAIVFDGGYEGKNVTLFYKDTGFYLMMVPV